MTYRPPHSTLDILFKWGKDADRALRENRTYHESYIRGRGHRDGQSYGGKRR
jgi:hypothetical protein